jgi:peptidyl-prolyl cis-trans isomerase SurA
MRRHRVILLALATVTAAGAAGAQAPGAQQPRAGVQPPAAPQPAAPPPAAPLGQPFDGIVAIVGTQPILRSDVQERILTLRQNQPMPTDSAEQAQLVKQVVNSLIDEEILVQKAKDEKIEVTDNELTTTVDQKMNQVRGSFASEQEFREQLKAGGFGTPEEYRRWLFDQARRSLLQQKLFEKLRQEGKLTAQPVTEAEVNEFFEKNKGQIPRLPATVTFRQIVITPKPSPKADSAALAKAESLLVEIRKGGDFEQVAKRESMDQSTKELGGDLGWHRRGYFVPEFDRVYFSLAPGQVSPVFKTTFGYHIVRVDRVQPAEAKGQHILIRPKIDSADIAAARREADSVVTQWRAGANYESLAAKHHDPAEEKSMPQPFPQEQLPKEYQDALKGKKAGEILDPFTIEDKSRHVPKFFIVQLTSVSGEREPSVADWRQQIRDRLSQEKAIRRYLDALRKETYVSVRL